jgi:hypothetical protein
VVKSNPNMPIKFDMSDPETAAEVGSWEDGQTYPITMVDSKGGVGEYTEEPAEEETPAPATAPGPAAVKAAMSA